MKKLLFLLAAFVLVNLAASAQNLTETNDKAKTETISNKVDQGTIAPAANTDKPATNAKPACSPGCKKPCGSSTQTMKSISKDLNAPASTNAEPAATDNAGNVVPATEATNGGAVIEQRVAPVQTAKDDAAPKK